MGVVIRQSFWGTAIIYAGVAIGYINSLILFPYFLDVESYGLIRLIQSNGMILIPVANLGMYATYIKYLPQFKSDETTDRRIFTFQLLTVTLGCIGLTALIYLFRGPIETFYSDESSIYNDYIYITVIIFVTQTLFTYFMAFYWSRYNVVFPNFLNEIVLRLGSTALIALYGQGWFSFPVLVLLIGLTYAGITLVLYIHLLLTFDHLLDWRFYLIGKQWIKKILGFGTYTLLVTTSTSIILNVTYPITSAYLGLEANAILTISVFIGTIIELPKRALSQITSAVIAQDFSDRNHASLTKVFMSSSINMGLISLLFGIGILTNLESLFLIIPKGDVFRSGFSIIVMVCIAKQVNMIGGISSEIINYSNFYKLNILVILFGAILTIGLNVMLVPEFGIMGAGLSILVTTVLSQAVRYLLIYLKLNIKPFDKKHIVILLLGVVVYFLTVAVPTIANPYFDILVRSGFTSILFLSGSYFLKISEEYNDAVQTVLRYLKSRHN